MSGFIPNQILVVTTYYLQTSTLQNGQGGLRAMQDEISML